MASERDASALKHPFLQSLGERVRAQRLRRGMTRRATAEAANISERHLANLEYGVGNVSILVLHQIAQALHCQVAELLGDVTTSNPEWLLLRSLLEGRNESLIRRVRLAAARLLDEGDPNSGRSRLIALIGLRGAGKSTLGRMLAEDLGVQFIELSREIEALAGCSTAEIQALYGQNAYRRYERRALEATLAAQTDAVIATPGGLVADPGTFNLLLGRCTTVWLQATPEDHMKRVLRQGDTRPMGASREAMADLKSILEGRAAFYAKADLQVHTSGLDLLEAYTVLGRTVRGWLGHDNA
jgi:XRE family aerobic/anaerobic benzoate catabolism transcriptional regulator